MFEVFFTGIHSLFSKQNDYIKVNILIPKETVFRTQLICEYICEEEECDFDLNTFIYLLYCDFIKQSVEHYNPEKTLKKLTTDYINNKTLIITNGYDNIKLNSNISFNKYTVEFDKEEALKGQLILNELHELFHVNITFNSLLSQLWISFIYDYKTGDNKKAFTSLKKMLQENIN